MRIAVAIIAIALAGCSAIEPSEYADCEGFIQGKLRAPSTYKRVTASTTYMASRKQQWVRIEYDAANAYGTPIRDDQICMYNIVNGKPDTSGYIDHDARLSEGVDADNMDALPDNTTSR